MQFVFVVCCAFLGKVILFVFLRVSKSINVFKFFPLICQMTAIHYMKKIPPLSPSAGGLSPKLRSSTRGLVACGSCSNLAIPSAAGDLKLLPGEYWYNK